jgi:hypothetical protein
MPVLNIRKRLKYVIKRTAQQDTQILVPREKSKVCECALVANEPGSALKDGVEDAEDAECFVSVAGYCRGDFFRVQDREP